MRKLSSEQFSSNRRDSPREINLADGFSARSSTVVDDSPAPVTLQEASVNSRLHERAIALQLSRFYPLFLQTLQWKDLRNI